MMTSPLTFEELWESSSRHVRGTIIAVDPGHTTGLCRLTVGAKHPRASFGATQVETPTPAEGAEAVRQFLWSSPTCDYLVVESYRIYGYKSDQHKWSELHTPRLIGALEYLAYDLGVPLIFQSAAQGKGFMTSEKLMGWGLWVAGQTHAQDAIRHAAYFAVFGNPHDNSKGGSQ